MTSRPASELLYESQATLRMVDTALDDLGLAPPPNTPERAVQALAGSSVALEPGDLAAALGVRMFWEIQALVESLDRSRRSLQRVRATPDESPELDEAARHIAEAEAGLARLSRLLGG
jgi:hypothetical protein